MSRRRSYCPLRRCTRSRRHGGGHAVAVSEAGNGLARVRTSTSRIRRGVSWPRGYRSSGGESSGRCPASEVLFVGDNMACDITAPLAYGMRAALVRPRRLRPGEALPTARFLIQHVSELQPSWRPCQTSHPRTPDAPGGPRHTGAGRRPTPAAVTAGARRAKTRRREPTVCSPDQTADESHLLAPG